MVFSFRGTIGGMAIEENRQFFGCGFSGLPPLRERHRDCERININMCSNDRIECVSACGKKVLFLFEFFLFIIYTRVRTCKVNFFVSTFFFQPWLKSTLFARWNKDRQPRPEIEWMSPRGRLCFFYHATRDALSNEDPP